MHYVGRLVSTGEEFLDTKAESQSGEPVQVVAGRGKLKFSRSNVSLHAHLISVKLHEAPRNLMVYTLAQD